MECQLATDRPNRVVGQATFDPACWAKPCGKTSRKGQAQRSGPANEDRGMFMCEGP